ncbi:MAG: hypothetical protein IPL80_04500 [Sterolibacteriaceae bacterium]|nr:hypothetical protein [Sterolibacteriaceae bacterium]
MLALLLGAATAIAGCSSLGVLLVLAFGADAMAGFVSAVLVVLLFGADAVADVDS